MTFDCSLWCHDLRMDAPSSAWAGESAQKDQVRGCKPDPVHSADAGLYVSWMWLLVTMLSITVFVFLMDEVSQVLPDKDPTGLGLSMTLAAVHFPMLALGVWASGAA